MPARLSQHLRETRERIDAMFHAAVRPGHPIDLGQFDAFRRALLQQLAIEEKVVMPALAARLGLQFEATRREIKARHRSMVALLVPTPCVEWAADLRELLDHDLERDVGPGGLHSLVDDALSEAEAEALLERAAALERVKVAPFQEGLEVGGLVEALLRNVGVT